MQRRIDLALLEEDALRQLGVHFSYHLWHTHWEEIDSQTRKAYVKALNEVNGELDLRLANEDSSVPF